MEFESTFIPGLILLHPKEFKDLRGCFIKIYNHDFFEKSGLKTEFKESYYSVSNENVIRGMHFQIPPAEHAKLVYVNQGNILDVVLDIRKNSPTFGKYFSLNISKENQTLVYIPIGCAHGFLSNEANTIVTYLQTSVYSQACDWGVRYDSFGMNWPVHSPLLSERDLNFPDFIDLQLKF